MKNLGGARKKDIVKNSWNHLFFLVVLKIKKYKTGLIMAELVFDIYRDHWARENNKLRKLRYAKHFKEYFECSCSEEDILSLRLESSPEGLFEVLGYVKDWVLFPFGYTTDRWFSQVRNHQKFRLHAPTVPSRLTQLRDDAYYNSTAWLAKLDTIVLTKNVYALVLDSTTIHKSPVDQVEYLMRRNFCGWV